jgi:uncharacterized protein (UPF0335 family)
MAGLKGAASPASLDAGALEGFVERIEALIEDGAAIRESIKDVYAEAAGAGFVSKTLKNVVKMRADDDPKGTTAATIATMILYQKALGMTDIERAIEAAKAQALDDYGKAVAKGADGRAGETVH